MTRNWFASGGSNYAKFRPTYPRELAKYIGELASGHDLIIDVGCGSGQLTALLPEYFSHVVGQDPSAEQIESALPAPGVTYCVASAEKISSDDGVADVVTAAQAAHWFDLDSFYGEVRRVAKPGGLLVLISYGTPSLNEEQLNSRFQAFYQDEIGPYWPPKRKLVDDGYRSIEFPFEEVVQRPMAIVKEMSFDEFLGYISTWSAVKAATEAGREDILHTFDEDFENVWSDESRKVLVTWPINIRIGIVH